MSKAKRESFIWSVAQRASIGLWRAWRRSRILRFLMRIGRHVCDPARLSFSAIEEKNKPATLWRAAAMRSRENSFFERTAQLLIERFLGLPTVALGLFGLLSCLFCAVFSVFLGIPVSLLDWSVLCAVSLSSLPLFTSRHTVAVALSRSLTAHCFCRLCERGEDWFMSAGERSVSPVALFLLSASMGGLLTWFGAVKVFVTLLFLLIVCFFLSFPEWCLVLTVSLFPFLQLLPHPTMALLILATILTLAWWGKMIFARRDLSIEIADLPILFFCVMLLLGGLISRGSVWEGICCALLVATAVPVRRMLSQDYCRQRVICGMQIGAALIAAIGVLQYFFTELPVMWVDSNRFSDLGGRVTSIFGNPNILAIYLLLSLPYALTGMAERRTGSFKRIFFAFSGALQFVCLILTWSRGAWLGVMFEVFLFLVFQSRQTRAAALLSPIGLGAVLPFLPSNILERFSSIGELSESSIRYRLYTWQGVFGMLADCPHGVGVGESAFVSVYPRYALSGIERVMHAHNVFLTVWVELGIVGLLTFSLVLLFPFLHALARGKINGGILALGGAAVMGLFDHLWYERGMLFLLFLNIAMSYVGGEREWNRGEGI